MNSIWNQNGLSVSVAVHGVVCRSQGAGIDEKTVSGALALIARVSVMSAYRKGRHEPEKNQSPWRHLGRAVFRAKG